MEIIKPHYEHIYCILYLQNRYLLDISCTYLLNRAGKRHDTSHLFLQMIQGNYLKSFAVDVILSCFKLSKNRCQNLASKKQFHTEFISYRRIVPSFESGI